jgi:hypothetical protein
MDTAHPFDQAVLVIDTQGSVHPDWAASLTVATTAPR